MANSSFSSELAHEKTGFEKLAPEHKCSLLNDGYWINSETQKQIFHVNKIELIRCLISDHSKKVIDFELTI